MNMKCSKCGRIWEAITTNEKCPFCGFISPKSEEFYSVIDALSFLVKNYGASIYQNPSKMLAYLSDYAPKYFNERRYLKMCSETGIFALFLSANEKNTNEEKIAAIQKSVVLLEETYLMASENAKKVLSWIGSSLTWDPSLFDGNGVIDVANDGTGSVSSIADPDPNLGKENNPNQLINEFEINGTTLISYHGISEAVCIPNNITKINSQAFKGCKSIQHLSLAGTIREIGAYAFSGCSALTEIAVPEGVINLEKGTFLMCTSLKAIQLPKSLRIIESFAFAGCCALETIHLPEGVTRIDDYAFQSCSNLCECSLPDSLLSLNSSVFNSCHRLLSIELPSTVCSIVGSFRASCPNLERVSVRNGHNKAKDSHSKKDMPHTLTAYWPESLKFFEVPAAIAEIGDGVFSWCKNLSAFVIPKTVRKIGPQAFMHCSGLCSVVFEGKDIVIGKEAFLGCESLSEIDLSAIHDSIPDSLFSECSRLSSVVIPDGIREIGNSAFASCKSLLSVETPRSVSKLGQNIFSGHTHSMLIYASHNECVIEYAKKHGLLYTDLSYTESRTRGEILRLQHAFLSENKTLSSTIDSVYAVKVDGTVVKSSSCSLGSQISFTSLSDGKWKNIKAIDTSIQHSRVYGVKNDGTVIKTLPVKPLFLKTSSRHDSDISTWADIRTIAVGETNIFGLKKDGTVIQAHDKYHFGFPDVSKMKAVIQLAAGRRHVVGLKQDGTIVSAGDNTFGQCAVDDWENIVSVYAMHNFTLGLTFDGRVLIAGPVNSKESEQCDHGVFLDETRLTSHLFNISRLFISPYAIVGIKNNPKGSAVYISIDESDNKNLEVEEISNEMFCNISDLVCLRHGLFLLQNNGTLAFTDADSKETLETSVFQGIKVPHYSPADGTIDNTLSLASG